jgi:hypothetical protein
MTRSAPILAAAAALALGAALWGCVPPNADRAHVSGHLKAVSKLDCPDSQGQLARTSASSDACAYSAGGDSIVQLKLIQVSSGDPQAALSPIEADLRKMTTYDPSAPPSSDSVARHRDWDADNDHDSDHPKNVNIDLPGLHVHASDGGKAKVDVGGIHVDADDKTNSAHVEGSSHGFLGHGAASFTVDANDSGAIIRSRSAGGDVHDDLILASDKPGPDGWRWVGYSAQGPRSGPLVVAVVQSRTGDHDRLFADVKELVRRASGD